MKDMIANSEDGSDIKLSDEKRDAMNELKELCLRMYITMRL